MHSDDEPDDPVDPETWFEENGTEQSPGPAPPSPPELPSESDVSIELRRTFWRLVLVFNVAVFGIAVGPMLIGFEGRWRLGGGAIVVGSVALAYGLVRYRRARRNFE